MAAARQVLPELQRRTRRSVGVKLVTTSMASRRGIAIYKVKRKRFAMRALLRTGSLPNCWYSISKIMDRSKTMTLTAGPCQN